MAPANSRHTRRVLWIAPSSTGQGGISTFVKEMQSTRLWQEWNVSHIATHQGGSVTSRVVVFLRSLVAALTSLIRHRPAIAHIHIASRGSFVRKCILAWIYSAAGVPVVMHVHGGDFDVFYENAPPPLKALIRSTLERADVVIGLGDTWVGRIRRMAPSANVVSVPCAVRPAVPVEQRVTGPVRCAFVGAVGERKGAFVLLRAWAKLLENSGVDATLTIAGNGETDKARDLVTELGISSTVTIAGWLPAGEVDSLLSSSQILVLASRNEGTPLAILEAMARGLCVIASDVGGIPELMGDTGLMVQPDDPDGLARQLQFAISTPEARARLGNSAYLRVKEMFDLDTTAGLIDGIYRDIEAKRAV